MIKDEYGNVFVEPTDMVLHPKLGACVVRGQDTNNNVVLLPVHMQQSMSLLEFVNTCRTLSNEAIFGISKLQAAPKELEEVSSDGNDPGAGVED